MHYVDEGSGPTILFVHGTPAWSFLYREQIKILSKNYRCVAPDHIGFGLSDKPVSFTGTPAAHSANLDLLIEQLDLKDITLVVHDFGGPIGLSAALQNPEKIRQLVILNTWLWATHREKAVQKVDRILNSALGRLLYLNFNFSAKVLMKQAFADRTKLSREIHRHYTSVFPDKASRYGLLRIGRSLAGASGWFEAQRQKLHLLEEKPAMLLWGMKDRFIQLPYLEKWKQLFPAAEVRTFDCGHFVQEEAADGVTSAIAEMMARPKH